MNGAVAAMIIAPCAGGALSVLARPRWRPWVGVAVALTVAAGVIAAITELVARGEAVTLGLGSWPAPLAIRLRLDGLSAVMLAMQAGVGALVSVCAGAYLRARLSAFWPLWLLAWAGQNGLYLTSDLFTAYVTLELIGVTAVGLVALAGGPAVAAAIRYLLVTLFGSLLYLAGAALLYAESGAVDFAAAAAASGSPAAQVAFAVMAAGLLLKTAAFPLHFWLPPAHANAVAPASAILSALVVKGSFYLLVRLWHQVFVPDAAVLGAVIGGLGVGAVLWGSAQALRQERLKMLIAYSTVAQLGYMLMAFALGGAAWRGAIIFGLSHACAKASMFLAAGRMARALGHNDVARLSGAASALPVTVFSFALAGVALIGLPPSGGFVGKWLLLEQGILDGHWGYVAAIAAGTILAVAYVFRVVNLSLAEAPNEAAGPREFTVEGTTLALALAALAFGAIAAPTLALLEIGAPFGGRP